MDNGAPEAVKTYPALAVRLIMALFSVVVLGTGVWAAHVTSEVARVKEEHEDFRKQSLESKGDIKALREKTEMITESFRDMRESHREMNRKMDDVLKILSRR